MSTSDYIASAQELLGNGPTVEEARLVANREERDGNPRDSIMALVAKSDAPTPWAFDNFIVDGDQVMIAGAPKSGKSWMALQLSLAAASGGQFLQWKANRKMRTLYLNLEVGSHMWSKRVMLQIGGAENALRYSEFFSRSDLRTIDVMDPDSLKQMREYIEKGGYEFVVVDVLSRCHSADENDNGSMKAVLFALRYMCGKATSVIVHHARKPPQGLEHANLGSSSIRGASSIVGEVDMAIVLVKRAGQGARFSVTMTARNVEVPDELLLDRADDMLYYEYEGDNSIERVIETAFRTTTAISVADLRKIVAEGLGVAEGTARNAINQAAANGLLERHKIGRHVHYTVPASAGFLRVATSNAYAAASGGDDCPF